MSGSGAIDCEHFDAHVDHLVLGQVDDPLRSRLLEHSADCARCRCGLDDLGAVVDRLLLAAPESDPPAGFEGRVLARLDAHTVVASHRKRHQRWLTVAAATVAIMVAATVFTALPRSDDQSSLRAPIMAAAGSPIGTADLVAAPTPHVLLTVEAYGTGLGSRMCELQRPDGAWVRVGSWDASDLSSGVWAVGIDPTLLDARAMRILTADGDTVATASFG